MNCKELAYLLADYLDGTMDPRMRAELDEHIADASRAGSATAKPTGAPAGWPRSCATTSTTRRYTTE
jgi:hypothetical protein